MKIEKSIDKDYLEFLKNKIVSLRLQTQPWSFLPSGWRVESDITGY